VKTFKNFFESKLIAEQEAAAAPGDTAGGTPDPMSAMAMPASGGMDPMGGLGGAGLGAPPLGGGLGGPSLGGPSLGGPSLSGGMEGGQPAGGSPIAKKLKAYNIWEVLAELLN